MRIINLTLTNFQGIKELSVTLDGCSASIYGDNATGKTTVYNAVTWLLFDRPSTGAKGYTPKTKTADGDAHYLDHGVRATLELENGQRIVLQKVFREVYKKKRGSASEEFAGHTTEYFIDGVPSKEAEYQQTIERLCGSSEVLKQLTMPDYFAEQMPWEARRRTLLEVCGDMTDDDVIAATPDLADLPALLGKPGTSGQRYTVDEYRKIAAARKTDINSNLQSIPARIDEAERAIPAQVGDAEDIDRRIEEARAKVEELQERRSRLLTVDGASAEAARQRAEAEALYSAAKIEHDNKQHEARKARLADADAYRRQANEIHTTIIRDEAEIRRLTVEADRKAELRTRLRAEYQKVESERWDDSLGICPTCHRKLPDDEVTLLRSEFNLSRSNQLTSIEKRGQREANQVDIDALRRQAEDIATKVESLRTEAQRFESLAADAEASIPIAVPFDETAEGQRLAAIIDEMRRAEDDARTDARRLLEPLYGEIDAANERVNELLKQRADIAAAETQRRRIAELAAEEKHLSAQYEEVEKGLYLCEQFMRAKAESLSERINSKFRSVRFRLFDEQINGGLKPTCEVMIPCGGRLVPYSLANNAARINAGLEIIDALGAHYGVSMPIIVDNAESVTRLEETNAQLIRLVVSPADSALRLELDTEPLRDAV